MSQNQHCQPSGEFRIKSLPYSAYRDVKNIARNTGITMTKFLQNMLSDIRKATPERIRRAKCEPCGEIRVSGINSLSKEEWQKIATYYGVDVVSIQKVKLRDALDNLPAHIKTDNSE